MEGSLRFLLPVRQEPGRAVLSGIQSTAFSPSQAHTHDSNLLAPNLEATAATSDHSI